MAVITFACYACNQVLQVGADKAGRKAKCSQCGTILTVPALAQNVLPVAEAIAPTPAAPPPLHPSPPTAGGVAHGLDEVEVVEEPASRRLDDFEAGPPRRRQSEYYDVRRRPPSKWHKVKLGFLLVFIGMCVLAGAFGFTLLGWLLVNAGAGAMVGAVLVRIGETIMFLGGGAAIVGHVFWLWISNRRGAFGFAIATLSVAGVLELFQIVHMASVYGSFLGGNTVVNMLVGLLRAAHFMMIAFYLRALAQTVADRIGAQRLERSAMLNVILCACLAGLELIGGIIVLATAPSLILGGGTGYMVVRWLFFWLSAIFSVVVFVFTILAVYQGKRTADALADALAHGLPGTERDHYST